MDAIVAKEKTDNSPSRLSRIIRGGSTVLTLLRGSMKFVFYLLGFLVGLMILISLLTSLDGEYNSSIMGDSENKIAILELSGVLTDSSSAGLVSLSDGQITPIQLISVLEDIKKDSYIKAVILRINSPGGTSSASAEMFKIIKEFKAETGLPIIASMSEVAASGGYYISLAADTIYANPSTITGSIGVVSSVINYQELANEYGVKAVTVSTGDNKDFLNPLSEVSESQTEILAQMLDQAFIEFKQTVLESRKLEESDIVDYFDGRPVTGYEAAEVDLVDSTGSLTDVITYARGIINDSDAQIIKIGSSSFIDYLLSSFSEAMPFSKTKEQIDSLFSTTGMPLYLYSP